MRLSHFVLALLSFFTCPLGAQSLVSDILNAHGGQEALRRVARVEVQGTITRGDSTQPFVLRLSGENSRFQVGDVVSVKQGMGERWWKAGQASDVSPVSNGDQDVYVLPFAALAGLASRFQRLDSEDFPLAFVGKNANRRFIGYDTPDIIELVFDPESRLLAQAQFYSGEGGETRTAFVYEDYSLVGRTAVATRVSKYAGDRLEAVFHITSINLNATFADTEFSF